MSLLLDDKPKRKTREDALAETPDAVRSTAEDVLRSPNLLAWVADAFEKVGIAGERNLALTVYLAGTSRLLSRPLAVIVQGPSSSGKSYVIEQVGRLFPPEAVLFATDLTPQALYYLEDGELVHRFLVAGERTRKKHDETAESTKALRELIASGELSKMVAISDRDGPRTEVIHKAGPIAYAESTTATNIFEEDANRCLVLQPDERPEQSRRIKEALARKYAGKIDREEKTRTQEHCHALQRLLEPLPVVIPFAEVLFSALPDEPIEIRRACNFVGSMIETSALLHQYQRERDHLGRIIASPIDYWVTRDLLGDVLARCLAGKPSDGLQRFTERLRKFPGEQTAKEIAGQLKMSERTVRELLGILLGLGLVEQSQPSRGPIPARWLISSNLELRDATANPLPPVCDICGVDESDLELPELPADGLSANLSDVPF
jgi:DNA-binding transcriptional ArsR family regulator